MSEAYSSNTEWKVEYGSIITLDDAKAHLNILSTDDDVLIGAKIDTASQWILMYVGSPYVDSNTPKPAPVQEACRQLVAHLYQNREASLVGVTAQALPLGFLDLLAPYRAYAF